MSGFRFRLAGIPVRVEPVFFLVIVLIGGLDRPGILIASFAAIAFGSILFHELAHAVAFRMLGRSPSIVLQAFGGVTSAPGPSLSRMRDVFVSAVGPLSQILVLGIPALLLREPVAIRFQSINWYIALSDAAWINLGWGILNLMPVLPLDGGRITAGLLGGARHGMKIAHGLGVVVAGAGAVWGLANQRIFLAMFGGMFAAINIAGFREQRNAPSVARIREGHAMIDAGDAAGALQAAGDVIESAATPATLRAEGIELAAWAHLARGAWADADAALRHLPSGTERSGFLAGAMLLDAGDADAAVVVIARAFVSQGRPPNRLLIARLVREGLVDAVAGALRQAGDENNGYGELMHALRSAGFADEAAKLARP